MATHKTDAELRAAIENLEIEYCLGRMLSRQFRRRKERLLKEIRRQKEKEEGEMLRRAKEKGSEEGATSTKPIAKTNMYIIPQLRYMKPVPQRPAHSYTIPKNYIEMWLRSEYGLHIQPVTAPLKDKFKFRKNVTKEMGLYVDC